MSDANNMRGYLKLFEKAMDYTGPMQGDGVSYSAEGSKGVITKITAFLKGHMSGRYTKLGRNLKRIEFLEGRIKKLKEETKGDTKELLADVFHAEDAVCTRVVETVGFVFELSKQPKDRETVKYKEVLEKLQDHLTPELIEVMQVLIKEHTSSAKLSPTLKAYDKREEYAESVDGGTDVVDHINQWDANFGRQLDQLKNMLDEGLAEDLNNAGFNVSDIVRINAPDSEAHGEYGVVAKLEDDGTYSVMPYGTGFHGYYSAEELIPASNQEVRDYYSNS